MLEPHHDFDPATEEGALVAAIRANPHDDTPKLVMADWQDDHGSPVVAAMYRHVVAKNNVPPTFTPGSVTRDDGVAVTRHAGMLSGISDRKPESTWLDGRIEDAVSSTIHHATTARDNGPLWSLPSGVRMMNRHGALYSAHNHIAGRFGRVGNYTASRAHQYAAHVHDHLAEQK